MKRFRRIARRRVRAARGSLGATEEMRRARAAMLNLQNPEASKAEESRRRRAVRPSHLGTVVIFADAGGAAAVVLKVESAGAWRAQTEARIAVENEAIAALRRAALKRVV